MGVDVGVIAVIVGGGAEGTGVCVASRTVAAGRAAGVAVAAHALRHKPANKIERVV
jgi:hypothetical protein